MSRAVAPDAADPEVRAHTGAGLVRGISLSVPPFNLPGEALRAALDVNGRGRL